jgi:hypothetical protein
MDVMTSAEQSLAGIASTETQGETNIVLSFAEMEGTLGNTSAMMGTGSISMDVMSFVSRSNKEHSRLVRPRSRTQEPMEVGLDLLLRLLHQIQQSIMYLVLISLLWPFHLLIDISVRAEIKFRKTTAMTGVETGNVMMILTTGTQEEICSDFRKRGVTMGIKKKEMVAIRSVELKKDLFVKMR